MLNTTSRHIVIGNWIDKADGTPKSNVAPISEGTSKAGNAYQITDTEKSTIISGTYPVGTILQSTTTFVTDTPSASNAPSAAPKSSKA